MKECIYRAARTFIQTAFGYLTVNVALVDFSSERAQLKSMLIGVMISAVSAGLAAIMNIESEANQNDNG